MDGLIGVDVRYQLALQVHEALSYGHKSPKAFTFDVLEPYEAVAA